MEKGGGLQEREDRVAEGSRKELQSEEPGDLKGLNVKTNVVRVPGVY